MDDLAYFSMMGFFLGYSREAVVAYIKRRQAVDGRRVNSETPSSIGTAFEHLGFIPSSRERAMVPEDVIYEINSRRLYSKPFPSSDEGLDEEFKEFVLTEPASDVLLRWLDFQSYVTEKIFLLEENDESHLRIDSDRRVGTAVQTRRPDREAKISAGIPWL